MGENIGFAEDMGVEKEEKITSRANIRVTPAGYTLKILKYVLYIIPVYNTQNKWLVVCMICICTHV